MMQQVAAQNTDIAAFGTPKVPDVKVKDNASEEFNKVFNDENWGYAKPVSPVSRTNGESHKTNKVEKVAEGDKSQSVSDEYDSVPAKNTESTHGTGKSDLQGKSVEHSTQVKSDNSETTKDNPVSDDVKSVESIEKPRTSDQVADSVNSELLSPEQQSHTQLMDFIAKLQSQQWRETETAEVEETLPLFESTEEKPQIISQALLNTLMKKLNLSAADEGSESELTTAPELLDDKLLTQLLAMLGGGQSSDSSAQSSSEVDGVVIHDEQEASKADLELLSILLQPASSEQAGGELLLPVENELQLDEDIIPEQLQLDMPTDVISSKGSDSQLDVTKPQQVGFATKPIETLTELPDLLQEATVKAQLELDTIAPVNKLVDKQSLKSLLKVPENKLEQLLTNLAQRIVDEQAPLEKVASLATVSTEQDKQLIVADFVTALKAGVDEFKQQLKQGREPGIDLKALVAEAVGKVAEASADAVKDPVKLEQVAKSFSQILELGQNISSALEQQNSAVNLYDRQVKGESNQLHIETAKTQTMQQLQNSQFDKAVNINKPEGHQQLSEKVQWMVNQKNMLAEIRLDPAELGSMSVKVNIQGDAASVSFLVQTQHARDALEQAVPRLREMLAEKGIALGQSSVQQEHKNKQDGDGSQPQGQFAAKEEDLQLDEQSTMISQRITNGALGGIDYFV
jgi:flagellar hook-length control protein FliK